MRVIPRASRVVVGGLRAGRLVVRVTAPPIDRAANDAAVAALAAALGLGARSIVITSGATARNKTVEVSGLAVEELRRRLAALGAV